MTFPALQRGPYFHPFTAPDELNGIFFQQKNAKCLVLSIFIPTFVC